MLQEGNFWFKIDIVAAVLHSVASQVVSNLVSSVWSVAIVHCADDCTCFKDKDLGILRSDWKFACVLFILL